MAKRLIDADALISELRQGAKDHRERQLGYFSAIVHITEQPTVDAVEVVRCRECRHYAEPYCMLCKERIGTSYRSQDLAYRKPDDFCSYGERKDGGQEPEGGV